MQQAASYTYVKFLKYFVTGESQEVKICLISFIVKRILNDPWDFCPIEKSYDIQDQVFTNREQKQHTNCGSITDFVDV